MKLCNDTVTVFNRRISDGQYVYVPSVIIGVSWYGTVDTSVGDKGLNSANRYTIRVPVDADFGGKTYVTPNDYKEETITSGVFTFDNGDVVVKAEITESMTPAALKEAHYEYCTILGITDNRRAPNAPHWKLVGS